MKLKNMLVAGAAALVLGTGGAAAVESAQPAPASAAVLVYRVSPTSEKPMRLCSWRGGVHGCREFKQGSYAGPVASFRQDAGCEYWAAGKRVFKRENRSRYRNYDNTVKKVTGALRNCRTTNRGDVAPRN